MAAPDIDTYLQDFSGEKLQKMKKIRALAHEMIPKAGESMAYGVPTIVYEGKNLFHFAGMKNHLGLYPTSRPIEHFKEQLKVYKTSRGTIQIPWTDPLPLELLREIIEYRMAMVNSGSKV